MIKVGENHTKQAKINKSKSNKQINKAKTFHCDVNRSKNNTHLYADNKTDECMITMHFHLFN